MANVVAVLGYYVLRFSCSDRHVFADSTCLRWVPLVTNGSSRSAGILLLLTSICPSGIVSAGTNDDLVEIRFYW